MTAEHSSASARLAVHPAPPRTCPIQLDCASPRHVASVGLLPAQLSRCPRQDTALHLGRREDRAQNHLAEEEEGCPGLKITFAGLCPARSRAPMVPAELRLAAEGEHGHPGLYVASALPVLLAPA